MSSGGIQVRSLEAGAIYPANWLPALTPSADVDLGGGGTGREGMDRTHGGAGKGLKQRPCLVEWMLLKANANGVTTPCLVPSWG